MHLLAVVWLAKKIKNKNQKNVTWSKKNYGVGVNDCVHNKWVFNSNIFNRRNIRTDLHLKASRLAKMFPFNPVFQRAKVSMLGLALADCCKISSDQNHVCFKTADRTKDGKDQTAKLEAEKQ